VTHFINVVAVADDVDVAAIEADID